MVRESVRQGRRQKGAGMVLDVTWKLRQSGQGILLAAAIALAGFGCASGPDEARNARIQNEKMDWMDKTSREAQARNDSETTVRSQSPNIVAPIEPAKPAQSPITPIANIAKDDAIAPATQGEPQVRVVATIGTTPIYEREVREAVYQVHMPELVGLLAHQRGPKEKEWFKEELRHIIERELILDELFAMLREKKQSGPLNQLKEAASKDAENKLRDIQKRAKLANDEEMKLYLQSQSLTVAGVRRHFERSFMMSAYLSERLKPKATSVSLIDVKDYYEAHPEEFQTTDRVKWQDLFIRADRFRSRSDAKKYSEWLLNRAAAGDDFGKLINEFDMGDSKSRGGMGFGEEKSKIFPQELEQTVFALKQGQSSMVEFESGFHIVRAAERNFAGKKPLDDQLQDEVRRKLSAMVNDREYKKIVETLWRRAQPQILVE
jgi:hypothetical protein